MKNKFIIIGIIVILFITIGIWFFHSNKNDKNDTEISKFTTINDQHPNLQLSVIDYPKSIETYCDKLSITLEVKNIAGQPLRYSDLKEGKYVFNFNTTNVSYPVKMAIGLDDFGGYLESTIDDFGTIEVGQTKRIVIRSGSDQLFYDDEYGKTAIPNLFAKEMRIFENADKKEFIYDISFNFVQDASYKQVLARSAKFTVISNIFDETGEMKVCPLMQL